MINFENRFDEYAYRVAYRMLDDSVTELEEGKWVTVNEHGKVVISDGTKKSFLCISSQRPGRDQISGKSVRKVTYLLGVLEVTVTNFDPAETYEAMTPLCVNADGDLTPYVEGESGQPWLIAAYSLGAPVNGELRICTAQ